MAGGVAGFFVSPLPFVFFVWLAFGPKGGLYNIIYGSHKALQRFWWPSRHILFYAISRGILGSLALDLLIHKKSEKQQAWTSVLLCLCIPLSLWLQGNRPLNVRTSPIQAPPPIYPKLASLDARAILQPPLSPKIAFSQVPLLQQLYHKKKLLTGHALWVDRVRPKEWDELIASNQLLAGLQQFETTQIRDLQFRPTDINQIRALGIDLVVVDQELFTKDFQVLVRSYVSLWTELLGSPILQEKGIWVWSLDSWKGRTQVRPRVWTYPQKIKLGDGDHAIKGAHMPSNILRSQ